MARRELEDIEEVRIDSLGQLLDPVTPAEHDLVSGRIPGEGG